MHYIMDQDVELVHESRLKSIRPTGDFNAGGGNRRRDQIHATE